VAASSLIVAVARPHREAAPLFNQEHINRLTENLRQAGLQASKVEIHRFHSTLVGAYLIARLIYRRQSNGDNQKTVLLALKTLVSKQKEGKSK
jgi:hypothetical protein